MLDIFNEYKDSVPLTAVLSVIFFGFFIALAWLYTQFNVLGIVDGASATMVYIILLIMGGMFFLIDNLADRNNLDSIIDAVGLGNPKALLISIGAGIGLGLILARQGLFLIDVQSVSWLADIDLRAFIFVVIVAPFVEEFFFRGGLSAFLIKNFGNYSYGSILAILTTSGLFALFHYAVYGASIELLMGAFMIGLIANVGIYLTKSLGFGLALHYTINYIIFNAMT